MTYPLLFRLVLCRLDAERAHALAADLLRAAASAAPIGWALRRFLGARDPLLRVTLWDVDFPSPVGVAAGVDKGATWFDELAALGFGFVEVGTVTALPQEGNPRPRISRLVGDRALINRMGFPNDGARVTADRLRERSRDTVVGVNVGKSRAVSLAAADEDYRASVALVGPVADYLVLNVSSPNTPGLRDMQAVERLGSLIDAVEAELSGAGRRPPLLVKISPDLSDTELDEIADLVVGRGLDGIIAVNTTLGRAGLQSGGAGDASGGLSGAPLRARAVEVLQHLRARVGDRVPLVSVGGIESADDVWDRILAGASLVQVYSGFVYGGPLWPARVNRELRRRAAAAGVGSIQELVGGGAR